VLISKGEGGKILLKLIDGGRLLEYARVCWYTLKLMHTMCKLEND